MPNQGRPQGPRLATRPLGRTAAAPRDGRKEAPERSPKQGHVYRSWSGLDAHDGHRTPGRPQRIRSVATTNSHAAGPKRSQPSRTPPMRRRHREPCSKLKPSSKLELAPRPVAGAEVGRPQLQTWDRSVVIFDPLWVQAAMRVVGPVVRREIETESGPAANHTNVVGTRQTVPLRPAVQSGAGGGRERDPTPGETASADTVLDRAQQAAPRRPGARTRDWTVRGQEQPEAWRGSAMPPPAGVVQVGVGGCGMRRSRNRGRVKNRAARSRAPGGWAVRSSREFSPPGS